MSRFLLQLHLQPWKSRALLAVATDGSQAMDRVHHRSREPPDV
jgi:hypothetical protein